MCVSSQFQPDPRRFNQCCPRVLQIGTKPNKNVVRLVKSLAGLEVELDIVGPIDAELMAALEDTKLRYQSFGRLSDEEILERYREADIVAFVSTEEGFGMPIVEAQCIERVCVTSNCSSMPEVAGAGACLVDPLDTQSIRAGFLRVIRDAVYREQLIAAGRENRTRFDAERIARQYSELYHLVFLESRSGRHLA
ncbi:MAG: glycosyltransferase [Planctomycetaceae bacterium]|nr:glycosyltransferase [Planctomycetaceae bacterium]